LLRPEERVLLPDILKEERGLGLLGKVMERPEGSFCLLLRATVTKTLPTMTRTP